MEYCSSNVMAYVLYFCKTQDPPIIVNSTKAQKLLYCCYGAVLAKFDERLTDEHPRAWMYGPVFPTTFNDINKNRLTAGMARQFERDCPPDMLKLIKETIQTFGKYTATQLSNWSHMPESPWSKADALSALDDREISIFFKRYIPVIEGDVQ